MNEGQFDSKAGQVYCICSGLIEYMLTTRTVTA